MSPLLRWAGSKRKLVPELLRHIPPTFDRYVEPFSGSACLFFALRPQCAILSDLNEELMETYRVVRAHPKLVYDAVDAMPRTKKFYYSLRDSCGHDLDVVARAARFVYLNRNCFNGVYRTNRKGEFNVPRGKRSGDLPSKSNFLRCAIALRRADLMHGDFADVVARVERGDFVYLDPPYAKRGSRRRGEYGYESFDVPDLERLAKCLRLIDRRGATFLLSYAWCREIRDLASNWHTRTLFVRRHVAGFQKHRGLVREILVSNAHLCSAKTPKSH